MSQAPIDPVEFKATQRELWSAVADGWKKWWPIFEAGAQTLSDRIVELARLCHGDRVLDIATGIGEPALTAARTVGPEGCVVATDLAPQMINLARERARACGLGNVQFREMDAEELSLESEAFDAALSRWGLMLMLDPVSAASGMRRALKPGGRLVAAVWGAKGSVPFISIPGEVAMRELAIPPLPEGMPGPLRLGRPGHLETVLEEAGLRAVEGEIVSVTLEYASPDEYVRFLRDLSGTLRRTLEGFPEVDRERVWAAIARAAEEHMQRDGRLRFVNEVRCAVGCR